MCHHSSPLVIYSKISRFRHCEFVATMAKVCRIEYDLMFHLSGVGSIRRDFQSIVEGTERALSEIKEARDRLGNNEPVVLTLRTK